MKIKLGTCYREAEVDATTVSEENRTATLSFSSEFPVERSFGVEILDHSPGAADLSRLNNKGPVLLDHDSRQLVGVVERAEVTGKRGVATVRFSKNPEGEKVLRDVLDGIRNHVSVGYRIHDMVRESEADGVETYRVTRFEPLEISMVGVPADPSVGMDRSYEIEPKEMDSPMSEPNTPTPAPSFDADAERAKIKLELLDEQRKAEKVISTRNQEIESIVKRANNEKLTEAAEQYIKTDRSLDDFRTLAFNIITDDAKPIEVAPPSEGMNEREMKEYSFTRAVMSCIPKDQGGQGGLSGFEREMSDEVAKRTGRRPDGFFIPSDVMHKRVLEVGTFTGAGALVGSTDGGQTLIELLRNNMAVMAMGATSLSGLTGDVDIPRQTGGGTASWLAEGATLTRADQTVGQLALRPHRLSASTAFSKQLLAQASPDVENFVRTDLMTVIAIAKDLACLRGTGASGQPQGIVNTSGLSTASTHTVGATFTWANAIDYEQNVEDNNALGGSMGYLMRPLDKSIAKATVRDSGGGGFVWDNDMVNGYRAMSTNQLTTGAGAVIFGNWADLIVADWDGTDVVVDPYSLSLNGQISVVIQTLTDCGVRHPESFSINAA